MKVLVACEYSGVVRDAFTKRGHDATSCDFLPSDRPDGKHYQGNMFDLIYPHNVYDWDLIIAHPPCTHLSVSGEQEGEALIQHISHAGGERQPHCAAIASAIP